MATSMKFVLGAFVLQFEEGASYPAPRPIEKLQTTERTAAGSYQVEDNGLTLNSRTLVFEDMLKTDHDLLKNWYDNVANGSQNNFEFTDERGFTGTVKILDKIFDFSEDDFELFSGSLKVEYQQ